MQTGMACLMKDASNVDNFRSWHKADRLTELEGRYERETEVYHQIDSGLGEFYLEQKIFSFSN